MKRIWIILISLSLILTANFVLAQISIPNPLQWGSIEEVIQGIARILLIFAIAIAPLMIIIAAAYLLTSAGEPKKIETAKKILLYTGIGIGVLVLSNVIMWAIRQIVGT